jgi:hypothetical protein
MATNLDSGLCIVFREILGEQKTALRVLSLFQRCRCSLGPLRNRYGPCLVDVDPERRCDGAEDKYFCLIDKYLQLLDSHL